MCASNSIATTCTALQAEIGGRPITADPCELAAVRWFHRGELPEDVGRFVHRILGLAAT